MTRIAVLGGTGYAGGHIVDAALTKGLDVVSYSRSAPDAPREGVEYRQADVTDAGVAAQIAADVDVIVSTLAPRGDMLGAVRPATAQLATAAAAAGTRLGVVGGAGSLFVAEGGQKVIDTDGFPDEVKPEAREAEAVLEDLRAADEALDWFFLSPAAGFGSYAPGEATGTYRMGGDVLLTDDDGNSFISGADFGLAVIDEVVSPAHRRARFTVAS
ncbi:NAD(P)-dependent oxidoreductase [Microbacterium sp. G2-8]|uniref:NAD(P)-dependent oxidoreductase n=1 Tax=Microbacterium sp. G2-8 TaxID=2842454 RepID=UPI001C8AA3B3|nr:NAD(P)H-binding protein [Microbacterium sp. G2-8]